MSTANPALPGGPNSPLATQFTTDYELGLVVDQDNLNSDLESQRNAIADVLAGILGTYNCQVADYPVPVLVSGLNLTVGGTGLKLFVQGRLADYIPTVNFTAGAASTSSDRIDGLFVQYTLTPAFGRSQTIVDSGGGQSVETVPDNYLGVTWSYIAGSPGGSIPATPAGYEAFASILVAQNSTVAVPTILFPTPKSQLFSGDIVTSLQALVGNILLTEGANVDITVEGNNIVIGVTGLVESVNDLSGTVIIQEGDGILVQTTGGRIVISLSDTSGKVTSLQELAGAILLDSPDDSILITKTGQTIHLEAVTSSGITAITSADDSVTVDTTGSTVDLSIAATGGYAAGNIQYRLRYEYGTSTNSLLSGGSSISPVGSLLGDQFVSTGVVSTVEGVFSVKVKPGAGAQTVSGMCNQSGGFVGVYLDGALIASQSSPTGTFTWSTSIPDDNTFHSLVLHVNDPGSGGINCIWSAWVPQNAYGGVDLSKIAAVVPGA
jgi:hypothetical protein